MFGILFRGVPAFRLFIHPFTCLDCDSVLARWKTVAFLVHRHCECSVGIQSSTSGAATGSRSEINRAEFKRLAINSYKARNFDS